MLGTLQRAGTVEQVGNLLARNPASAVALNNPSGVARLLDSLQAAGASGQVAELSARAAADASLEDPLGLANLLDRLRAVGEDGQVTKLLARNPASTVALDNRYSVDRLLDNLRSAGEDKQVTELTAGCQRAACSSFTRTAEASRTVSAASPMAVPPRPGAGPTWTDGSGNPGATGRGSAHLQVNGVLGLMRLAN